MNTITAITLAALAQTPGCPSDLNEDAFVDRLDLCILVYQEPPVPEFTFVLLTMLQNWGPCHE